MQVQAQKILRQTGFKCTPGRVALLTLLLQTNHPLTIREIYHHIEVELSQVSIYRALQDFKQAGITHEVQTGKRGTRYALCTCSSTSHCHPHFACRGCGQTVCLTGLSLPDLKSTPPGYTIEGSEVYLTGLCPQCN